MGFAIVQHISNQVIFGELFGDSRRHAIWQTRQRAKLVNNHQFDRIDYAIQRIAIGIPGGEKVSRFEMGNQRIRFIIFRRITGCGFLADKRHRNARLL